PVRHHDDGTEPVLARGVGDGLSVIARRRRDNPADLRFAAFQFIEVDETAAELEGTDRAVVLVFDPQLKTEVRLEEGPAVARGGGKVRTDQRSGRLDPAQGGENLHGILLQRNRSEGKLR